MARFNAALRERTTRHLFDEGSYLNPTVRSGASLGPTTPSQSNPYPPPLPQRLASRRYPHYFLCVALQLLTAFAFIAGGALLLNAGFSWSSGPGQLGNLHRSWSFAAAPVLPRRAPIGSRAAHLPGGSRRHSGLKLRLPSVFWLVRPWSRPIHGPPVPRDAVVRLYLRALGRQDRPRRHHPHSATSRGGVSRAF